jgi:pyruvate,water dikinase
MISRLADIAMNQQSIFGGKAANLGFLIKQGFNVPDGIALSLKSMDELDIEKVKELLNQDKFYSVRSSGTAEDGVLFSFAGQYETVLGVKLGGLENALQKVFDSQTSERVIKYAGDHQSERFGIIIQEMVVAEISGIMFTANPIDSDRQTMCIESVYGLGENIVSGLVNTGKYMVKKTDLQISSVETSLKEKALEVVGDKLVNREINEVEPSLKYEKLLEVARLGIQIEKAYGSPQDIEFALEKGEVFLLQTRPITTLWPSIEGVPDEDLLINFNAVQMMMEPFSPLGSRAMQDFARIGEASFLHFVNGYGYAHVHELLSNRYLKKFTNKVLHYVDEEIQLVTCRLVVDSGSRQLDFKFLMKTLGFFFPKVIKARWRMNQPNIEKLNEDIDQYVFNFDRDLKDALEGSRTSEEKIMIMQQIMRDKLVDLFGMIMPSIMAAMMLQNKIVTKWGQSVLEDIEKGLENNLASQMGRMIEEMSDYLIQADYKINSSDQIGEIIRTDPVFKVLHHEFMRRFGFRGIGEIDIATPRYKENEHQFFTILYHQYQSGEIGKKKKLNQRYKAQAKVAEDAYGQIIRNYRTLMGMREHPKYAMSKMFMVVRQTYLSIGDELKGNNRIGERGDIFYLYPEEISDETISFKPLIVDRKQEYLRNRKLSPAKVMNGSGRCFSLKRSKDTETITGTAASSGVITARIRVVNTIEEAIDLEGKILVTRFTDPGWTPVFKQITGLITEVGGLMTHGSVVAREYGIPAVVGVAQAMEIFNDGELIELDGSTGIVKKL